MTDEEPGAREDASPELLRAKRAFEGEDWGPSIPLLHEVAVGRFGDALLWRQIAEYWIAIALYRLNAIGEAAEIFAAIARAPNHIKRPDSIQWGMVLIDFGCVTTGLVSAMADARPSPVCRPPSGPSSYAHQMFVKARGLYELGRDAEALGHFRELEDHPRYGAFARVCAAAIPE